MTNPHGIISVETVNTESIPTLTLADYAFSSSNNAGTADRGKDAKITFNTTTDTFAITVKNNADNSNLLIASITEQLNNQFDLFLVFYISLCWF